MMKREDTECGKIIGKFIEFVPLVVAVSMVWAGFQYRGEENCRNGADTYLLYGGVVNLVAILAGQVSNFCTKKAMADGIIDQTEKRNLTIMKVVGGLVALVQVVILFWGTVVVFGSYANWTYEGGSFQNTTTIESLNIEQLKDNSKYEDHTNENFCKYEPMTLAFVLLILAWVMIPLMCCCLCCGLVPLGAAWHVSRRT